MADPIADAYVRVRPDTSGFKSSLQRSLSGSFGSGFKGAAGVTLGVTSVVGALSLLKQGFTSVVTAGAAFETELNTFQAVTAATGEQMKRAGDLAKQLGQDVKLPAVSAADAAVAMTELAKGGLSVKDSLAGVRGALELGTAANTDFATSAQVIARNLAAFQLTGENASRVADLLAGASIAATGEVSDMAIALQQSATVAHAAGISVEDTVTAIAELAKAGLVGSDAGTSLRTMILRLVPATNKAAETMKDLGVKTLDLHGSLLPLPQIAENYRRALAPLSQAQRQMALNTIFGQDAIRSATIFASGGAKGFEALAKTVTKVGQANVLTTARTKGLGGSIGALHSNLETIGITIAQKINPSIKRLVDFLNSGLSQLPAVAGQIRAAFQVGGAIGGLEKIREVFAGLSANAKIAVVAIGAVTVALVAMAAAAFPITATVLAISGLVVAFKLAYDRSELVRDAVDRVKETVQNAAPAWQQLRATAVSAITAVRAAVQVAVRVMNAIWQRFGGTLKTIARTSFGGVKREISLALGEIKAVFDVFAGVFTGDWRKVWNSLKTLVTTPLKAIGTAFKTWGGNLSSLFEGIWQNLKEIAIRGVAEALRPIAAIPTKFSIFGKTFGFENPAKRARDHLLEELGNMADARAAAKSRAAAKEIADAFATNSAAALTARTRDVTVAVEGVTTHAVKKAAAIVKPAVTAAGKDTGKAFTAGVKTGITDSATDSIKALQDRLTDAIKETKTKVRDAVLAAQRSLTSLGGTLATQLQQIVDNGPIGQALKRLQDRMTGQQGRQQSKQLRQAIVDAQNALASAQGKRLPGVRPDAQATGLRAAVAAAKKDLADARAAIGNVGAFTPAQKKETAAFLKPQLDAYHKSQNALGDYIRQQRTTLKGARGAYTDFANQKVVAGLQARAEGQKQAIQKRLTTIVDDFNRGAINFDVFNKRITNLLQGRTSDFKTAGKTLGIVFAREFNDQVAGLLLQAKAIQAGRDKGLPGFLGQGSAPDIAKPLTVLTDQLQVQRDIRAELRLTRTRAERAAAKADAKANAKKKQGGISTDLSALQVGSTS